MTVPMSRLGLTDELANAIDLPAARGKDIRSSRARTVIRSMLVLSMMAVISTLTIRGLRPQTEGCALIRNETGLRRSATRLRFRTVPGPRHRTPRAHLPLGRMPPRRRTVLEGSGRAQGGT